MSINHVETNIRQVFLSTYEIFEMTVTNDFFDVIFFLVFQMFMYCQGNYFDHFLHEYIPESNVDCHGLFFFFYPFFMHLDATTIYFYLKSNIWEIIGKESLFLQK